MLPIFLVFAGILSRVFIHLPNFTPILAIALFSGVYLKQKQALTVPLLAMIISDVILGFHSTALFTLGSMVLVTLMGFGLKGKIDAKNVFTKSVYASLVFFVVSNLGVWLVGGLYPLSLSGLETCFVLALPFFKSTLLSTLIYSFVLFFGYEQVAASIRKSRFAHVL